MSASRPTVAIAGAGFSGLLTALHLLSQPDGPCVRLIERRNVFGRGAAYSTHSDQHLLNVRASNMSAFPDRPGHFVDWLRAQGTAEGDAAFVTRARFGDYLQAMLRAATEGEPGRLLLEGDAAVALQPDGQGWRVTLAMGRSFRADAVVLAVGNLPPHLPPGVDEAAASSPCYFGDPWAADFGRMPEAGAVLLIGAGLTMVDVALRLAAERPGLRMLALSRRGLPPRRHLGLGPSPVPFAPEPGETPSALLRRFRRTAETGVDWRALVDGLRPHVQALWRSWTLAERRRFLRHLRPWWDIHRHRLAPEVASRLDHLTASGALAIAAGRIAKVRISASGGLEASWTPRRSRAAETLELVGLVNCTGPNGDLLRVADPLLGGLARDGLIRADACRLGLDVGADGRLVGSGGAASPSLYAVGPVTRGAFWEITSVPDIRVQAAACATAVGEGLRARGLLA